MSTTPKPPGPPSLDRFSSASDECDLNDPINEEIRILEQRILTLKTQKERTQADTVVKADLGQSDGTPSIGRRLEAHGSSMPAYSLPELLNLTMGMPRKEIMRFDGNPLNYWKFYRGFVSGVAQYVSDPANRLMYLIQYCDGEAKDSIDHCTILDPEEGYEEAWRILKRRFGEPTVIARDYLSAVVDGPPLKPNDSKGLTRLAETMKACELTLSQLNYASELNTRSTIGAVIRRLPRPLQSKWCDVASLIFRQGRDPTFADVTRFVEDRAESASIESIYMPSQVNLSSSRSDDQQHRPQTKTGVYTLSTNVRVPDKEAGAKGTVAALYKPPCPCCNGLHYIDQCSRFISMPLNARHSFVASASLCALCLKPRHNIQQCRSRRMCGLDHCQLPHHPLLHPTEGSTSSEQAIVNLNSHSVFAKDASAISLGVVKVRLRGPSREMIVNALLDSGSDSTMILCRTAESLGLTGSSVTIKLTTMNGQSLIPARSIELCLSSLTSEFQAPSVKAWAVDKLPPITHLKPDAELLSKWTHLSDVQLADIDEQPISVLIGMNVPAAHWVLRSRTGRPNEPYAALTPLGWIILGPFNSSRVNTASCNYLACSTEDEHLQSRVEDMFNLEFNESTSDRPGLSAEDELALKIAHSSVKKVDGHYQLPLPWKLGCPKLPPNYHCALHRLISVEKRLRKDLDLQAMYASAITEYVAKGFAERVQGSHNLDDMGRIWYLPHHPVVHPHKPGKVRVVFDCACRVHGISLNSQLLTGPDMVNSLFGVLLRFRQFPFVLTADIESMFHQVKVPERDRDCLRFLWREDINSDRSPDIYRMTVHPFGATSSPFCAGFALRQTLKDYGATFDSWDYHDAARSFYVDDCLYSAPSEKELISFFFNVRDALSAGGFHLTKWSTNSSKLLQFIPTDQRADRTLHLDLQPSTYHRTLGVRWNTTSDVFEFEVDRRMDSISKRSILSFIASIYDPLGLIGPLVLPGRLLFQELCRIRCGWDDPVPEEMCLKWNSWILDLLECRTLRVARCLFRGNQPVQSYELHCFSDAAGSAYGAALYLRYEQSAGVFQCSLICGKSRVAPLKSVTIPRLELVAALLSARLASKVQEELSLPIAAVTFWTDSMIVLQAIRNTTSRFKTFVANRVAEIRDLSDVSQWRYVDTRNNPADAASRGLTARKLRTSTWFHGPTFLACEDECWPKEPEQHPDILKEVTLSDKTCLITNTKVQEHWFDQFDGFGTWMKLVRAVAWLMRFYEYIKQRKVNCSRNTKYLTSIELEEASRRIVKFVQLTAFAPEIRALSQSSGFTSRSLKVSASPLRRLNPFFHDGVIRVGGRLKWSLDSFDAKYPMVVPRKHFVTRLIIQHYHERNGHVGASQVLSAVRQRYWILQGHAAVRSVLSECRHCRRWHSAPCGQMIGPLPIDRVLQSDRPFAYVGVDYFGPLLVKRGRATEKRYGCVFTCLTVRAVHIELSHSLETDSFICAFSRFVSRRGSPLRLRSDNGQNFRGAESEVRKCMETWNQERIVRSLANFGCDWEFSAPTASHQGGVWERMIRSIRRILKSLLGSMLVDDETLSTFVTEVEKILNDRPLVKLTSDPLDYSAITPNHILLLYRNPAVRSSDSTRLTLAKRWRLAQSLADQFWSRWRKEYLPTLQTAYRWLRQGRNLRQGDLVLIGDKNAHRGQWLKGIVESAVHSGDGLVREVTVRTNNGIYRRDVRQLYLLEASGEDEAKQET